MNSIQKLETYMIARKLSPKTQVIYKKEFADFRKFCNGADLRNLNRDLIMEYLARLYSMGYSDSKVNQAINAIKFWNEKVLGRRRQFYFIKRPYRDKVIPNIITPEKMRNMIYNTRNLKHLALLHLTYHHGLRISEIQKMTIMDVRGKCENPHIVIRESKHGKSRIASLNKNSLELLREYYGEYKPKQFLFEGEKQNKQYSKTSMRRVLEKACKRERIEGRFRFHDLRHNFITHALQAGTNIYHLSEFVGCGVRTIVKTYAHLLPQDIKIYLPGDHSKSKIVHLYKTA